MRGEKYIIVTIRDRHNNERVSLRTKIVRFVGNGAVSRCVRFYSLLVDITRNDRLFLRLNNGIKIYYENAKMRAVHAHWATSPKRFVR